MSKKIAVIGSNSFSGAHFIDLLLGSGRYSVIGISRSLEKKSYYLPYKKRKNSGFVFYRADLNKEQSKLRQILKRFKPDYIVNFAGLIEVSSSWKYPEEYFRTNTLAQVSLIKFIADSGFSKKYIHISTPEVYGSCRNATPFHPYNPSTPYAASKAGADMYLSTLIKNTGFNGILTRSTNVYGPGQQLFRIIPKTIISLKLNKTIPLEGGGKAIKSYIHIKDVCEGIILAMEKGQAGGIYHFSPDEGGMKVIDIVKTVCKIMGRDFQKSVKNVPDRIGQDSSYIIDSSKSRKNLHWFPKIG